MRVLIFSTDDHLYPAGGAESAMGEITKRMPDVQFDLVCARLRRSALSSEHLGNVRIFRVGFGVPKLDGYLLALFGHIIAMRLHRQQSYDLIWSIMASYGAFSAVRVKRKTGLPFLLTLQEGDDPRDILRSVRWVRDRFRQIFACADGLQPISVFLQRWGQEMGFRGAVSKVIPNGVDVGAFTQDFDPSALAQQRKIFGFPDDAFVLITSSRLVRKNGVGDIIEALPFLPPNVCLVVCGSGALESVLRARVSALGLVERVRFLGFVKMSELPKLLKASDAFIRPSLSEGLGNAFLEAMAAGIPVIGTPVGGIPDFLVENETGFLCRPQHPHSIAEAVTRVIHLSSQERQRIRAKAQAVVAERYSWDLVAGEMRQLFERLTDRR